MIDDARGARWLVVATLTEWGLEDLVEDCSLVVSELATNAIRYASSAFTVSLLRLGQGLHVSVADSSERLPQVRTPARTEPGGRGLPRRGDRKSLGYTMTNSGKVVWARLQTAG